MDIPESPDAERAVLGAIFIDQDALGLVIETLRPDHFYGEKNRIIYQAIIDLDQSDNEPDVVSVTEHLRQAGLLDRAGSIPYLMGVMEDNPGAWLIEQHADIVREKARLRSLLQFSQMVKGLVSSGDPSEEVLNAAEQALANLEADASGSAPLVKMYADEAESILDEKMGGYVQTGFYSIDRMMGGLKGVVILAARPSVGKSSLARDIMRNLRKRGKKGALLSPDQSGADILRMEASLASGIGLTKIKGRQYTLEEAERWRLALHHTRDTLPKLTMLDDRPLTLPSLTARFRSAVRWGAELVVVDYMQLVDVPGMKASEEYHAVTAVSKAIKRLTRETGVPALILAQLNRNTEGRSNPRPIMADLRSSGQIEQDADAILFLHRPDYGAPDPDVPVDVLIAKQKDGPTGTIQLMFRKAFSTFYGL
jgi:replicative DNA helicase